MVVSLFPVLVFAQTPPEGLDAVGSIVEAAKGGKWSLFASLVIMLLVWAATKAPVIKDWVKGEARIWVAASAGVLSAFAMAIYIGHSMGAVNWLSAILEGLSVGLAAGGLWSLVGRKLAGKPIDADGDGVLDPEQPVPPAPPAV